MMQALPQSNTKDILCSVRYEISLRVLVVALFASVWATLPWDSRVFFVWIPALIFGIGWLIPYTMKQRSGWLFWTNIQACRGLIVLAWISVACSSRRSYDLDTTISLFLFFFLYLLPREVALLIASVRAGRIVWLEEWVRPMTDEIARLDLEKAQKEKPELTLAEHQEAWRKGFLHDGDVCLVLAMTMLGLLFGLYGMAEGHWHEGVAAAAITALVLSPLVWRVPSPAFGIAVTLIACTACLLSLAGTWILPADTTPAWTPRDIPYMLLWIVTVARAMQYIAGLKLERPLTADEVLVRGWEWYVAPKRQAPA
ncbi:hypothetical protein DB346_24630 [Verrucomicrobia bacterium LW23]|nr:hypothetical protein DB346_24630 [Verrucomicrobia bacterium LW23]